MAIDQDENFKPSKASSHSADQKENPAQGPDCGKYVEWRRTSIAA
jgi:hypothetical protein